MQYLTVKNALKDIVRFANHFVAPWTDDRSTANDVPWILIGKYVHCCSNLEGPLLIEALLGGSYSAAQTGWIANIMPGVFWAYLAASPILQAVPSYWAYYLPLIEHGPESCLRLIGSVTQLIDRVVEAGDEENLQEIKTLFGLAEMKTPDFLYSLRLHWSEWSTTDVGQNSTTIETYCAWVGVYGRRVAPVTGLSAEQLTTHEGDVRLRVMFD